MAKAQKGDLIRVVQISEVNERIDYDHKYKVGEIYEVIATHEIGEGDNDKPMARIDTGELLYDDEYEIHRKAGEEDSPKTSTDAVNPQHYKQGRTEVIDIIEDAVVGADPFEAVCQANVLKYTLRYRHKNGVEDLKKAVWYAEKLIEHLTQK